MGRMRTINSTIEYLKEIDPKTSLTKNALRQLILSKRLPACRVGTKILVNLDTLENFLNGELIPETTTEIRKIRLISN